MTEMSANSSFGSTTTDLGSSPMPHTGNTEAPALGAVRLFLIMLIVFILAQAAISFALNPAGAFRASGLIMNDVRSTYAYQKLEALDEFLKRTSGTEITIALGSSRMIVIPGPNSSDDHPYFFNAAIDGGKAEDVLAITEYILEQPGVRVRRVFINPDFHMLGTTGTSDYAARLDGVYELDRYVDRNLSLLDRIRTRYMQLENSDWIIASVERLLRASPTILPFDIQSGTAIEEKYFAPRQAAYQQGQQLSESRVHTEVDQIESWGLSERRVNNLEDAIDLWTSHDADVVLIHMPYPQPVWEEMHNRTKVTDLLMRLDTLLTSGSSELNVAYCNFSDPSLVGVTDNTYWWDSGHYTAAAAQIIFAHAESCASRQFGEAA